MDGRRTSREYVQKVGALNILQRQASYFSDWKYVAELLKYTDSGYTSPLFIVREMFPDLWSRIVDYFERTRKVHPTEDVLINFVKSSDPSFSVFGRAYHGDLGEQSYVTIFFGSKIDKYGKTALDQLSKEKLETVAKANTALVHEVVHLLSDIVDAFPEKFVSTSRQMTEQIQRDPSVKYKWFEIPGERYALFSEMVIRARELIEGVKRTVGEEPDPTTISKILQREYSDRRGLTVELFEDILKSVLKRLYRKAFLRRLRRIGRQVILRKV